VFSSEQKQDLVYNVKENDQREIDSHYDISEYPVFDITEAREEIQLPSPSTSLNAVAEGREDTQLPSSLKNSSSDCTSRDIHITLSSTSLLNSERKGIDLLAVSLRPKLLFLQDFSYLCAKMNFSCNR